jgi:sortase A
MVRKTGFALLGLGALLVAWVAVTITWGDPITSLYTRWEQRGLSRQLDTLDKRLSTLQLARSIEEGTSRAAAQLRLAALLRARADTVYRSLRDGQPIGRIVIPRIHLNMVVVEGTSDSDLRRAPGHYDAASGENTAIPGMGGVIAIAGHRTTYLHPFRHIDDIRPGDNIYL